MKAGANRSMDVELVGARSELCWGHGAGTSSGSQSELLAMVLRGAGDGVRKQDASV